jgi:hypothetical protein
MSLAKKETPSLDDSPIEDEIKYCFIGVFCHGGYGREAQPYKSNAHASTSLRQFTSTPTLMTFMNCAPGNVLLGEDSDNKKLINYFFQNSNTDLTTETIQSHNKKTKNKDQIISENFLAYVKTGLKELRIEPRDRTEQYKKRNKTDVDVCRNSFICKNQVGISHTYANKTFSTDGKPETVEFPHWGVFIYNNNCGISYGRNIKLIPGIRHTKINDDEDIGIEFNLSDIINDLTKKCKLSDKDYLCVFDYSCSNFENPVNPTNDERLIRKLGNNVVQVLGFKRKHTKKGGKNDGKKKTRKYRKNNGVC